MVKASHLHTTTRRFTAHGEHQVRESEDHSSDHAVRGMDGDREVGRLAANTLVKDRVTVLGTHRLPEQVEIAAYYGVSEALTNTAKHAAASIVQIQVDTLHREGTDTLRVQVHDDGRGGATLAGGTGLLGIKDRAEALGGRLFLHSPPETGTTLRLELPLTTTNGDPIR